MKVGNRASFTRNGKKYIGKIEKINAKTVKIKAGQDTYMIKKPDVSLIKKTKKSVPKKTAPKKVDKDLLQQGLSIMTNVAKDKGKSTKKDIDNKVAIVEGGVISLGKKAKDKFGKIIIYNITGTKKNDYNSAEIAYYVYEDSGYGKPGVPKKGEKGKLRDLGHISIDDIKINKRSISANPKKIYSSTSSWKELMGYE